MLRPLRPPVTRVSQDRAGSNIRIPIFATLVLLLVVYFFFPSIDTTFRQEALDFSPPVLLANSAEYAIALRDRVHLSIEKIDDGLRKEYGQYYQQIFRSNYSDFFNMGELSRERLVRRMTRKLVESLMLREENVTFTWVTSGHSSAAGHGNLFNQSYTHTMEAMVSDVFASAGLTFVGKNYAMGGGMSSGPEQAMCMESLFGSDLDILSWDYDITDNNDHWQAALWSARAASHPSQPTLVMVDTNIKRWALVQGLENVGVGVIQASSIEDAYKGVPDYEKGENQKGLPKSLKKFICNGIPESGKCTDYKWDTKHCYVEGQVPWHHGWKRHKLRGSILGHFMISILKESVDQLMSSLDVSLPKSILDTVNSKDKNDREMWMNSNIISPECRQKQETGTLEKLWPSLYKGNSICSSALMPSEERFSGVLTGISGTFGGKHDEGVKELYDAKVRSKDAVGKNVSMAIVQYISCLSYCNHGDEGRGARDSQDYYYIGGVKDEKVWHTKTVPNDSEYSSFSKGAVTSRNYIMICVTLCNDGFG